MVSLFLHRLGGYRGSRVGFRIDHTVILEMTVWHWELHQNP